MLPSAANFLFTKHAYASGKALFEGLRARDVLVRRWDKPRIAQWLRVSVGTPEQTEQLLGAVAEALLADT